MSIVFLELHSTSTFLLTSPSYSSFSDTYHNLLHIHIFPCFLLLLATNNSSSPTLSSSTFLHVHPLVYHGVTGLSLPSMLHPSVHTPFLSSTPKSSSICYSSPLNTFTPTFFISFTTLTTSSSLPLAFLFFLLYLLLVPLLLF